MSPALLAALIAIESGGNDAAIGRHGERGALQISSAVVRDVNRVYGFTYQHSDMHNRDIAVRVATLYLDHYARGASDEVLARTWNGGPRGPHKKSTIKHWNKVKKHLKK